MAAKKEKSFKEQVYAYETRDEKDVQKEEIDHKVDLYAIEIQSLISQIEVKEIPTYEAEIKKQKGLLELDKKKHKDAYFQLGSNLREYLENIKSIEATVSERSSIIAGLKNNIEEVKEEKERLEKVLYTLKS